MSTRKIVALAVGCARSDATREPLDCWHKISISLIDSFYPSGPEEMVPERTALAIIAGISRRLRQMIQLMPQLSFLSSVEDSCSGSKSSSATACDASPCAPLYTIAWTVRIAGFEPHGLSVFNKSRVRWTILTTTEFQ